MSEGTPTGDSSSGPDAPVSSGLGQDGSPNRQEGQVQARQRATLAVASGFVTALMASVLAVVGLIAGASWVEGSADGVGPAIVVGLFASLLGGALPAIALRRGNRQDPGQLNERKAAWRAADAAWAETLAVNQSQTTRGSEPGDEEPT